MATCSKGFVICFLKVPLLVWTAAVQPNGLWNFQKTFYKTIGTSCRPRLYISLALISFRLYQRCKHADKSKQLPCPAMNTHDAITKTCLDNYYSQRESVVDALKRCTDSMLAGKTVLICGYGQASSDILFLKHACSILRQYAYPVCQVVSP